MLKGTEAATLHKQPRNRIFGPFCIALCPANRAREPFNPHKVDGIITFPEESVGGVPVWSLYVIFKLQGMLLTLSSKRG